MAKELVNLFEEKLEKFAKKFAKYGGYSYEKSEPYVCEDEDSRWYRYTVVDIEVDAKYKVGDYQFVASLEWIEDAGENLIKKASEDVFVPEIYKTRRECDHCKTNRLRIHTIILKSSDEYIQVGKSCVKDYIGVDLGNYASYLTFFDSLEEFLEAHEFKGQSHWKKNFEVKDVLAQAYEESHKNGYISKATAVENDCDSTATKVFYALNGITNFEGKLLYEMHEFTDKTWEEVGNIYKFYEELEVESDYINNIKTILKSQYIQNDEVGLVVSAIGTKLRIENEREERAKKVPSEFVGSVGDRITFKAIPVCIYSTYTNYGMLYIYKMTVDNNVIVWHTSKDLQEDVEFEITATIKEHSEYRGEKQTEVTRARVKRVA